MNEKQSMRSSGIADSVSSILANSFARFIYSFLFGSIAMLTAIKTGIWDLGVTLEDIRNRVDDVETLIRENGRRQDRQLDSLFREIAEKMDGEFSDLSRDLNRLDSKVSEEFASAGEHRDRLHDQAAKLLDRNRSQLVDEIKQTASTMKSQEEAREARIINAIDVLSLNISSIHKAFVTLMDDLVKEGRNAVDQQDQTSIRRWMNRVNYIIRSLAIQEEDGFFADRAVIKKDLQKLMAEYDKSQDIQFARQVLVIVESTRDLVAAGRIP